MRDFKAMTNLCIATGLRSHVSTLKRLSSLSYRELKDFDVPSYYKLCAISKAAGILASRKKSIRRGNHTKNPYLKRLVLTACYGFRIVNGKLLIPIGSRRFEEIPLVPHTIRILATPSLKVNSFTLTENVLSISISKEVEEMKELAGTIGVDRNLRNITVGNENAVKFYELSKAVEIAETTNQIVKSFKRNDARIRQRIASKYGQRREYRVRQLLHQVSKDVVENAKRNHVGIVFEDIHGIGDLYRKGNGKGPAYRRTMKGWPFYEIKRQIEYKAAWAGVPVTTLTRSDTRGTSVTCFQCGERLQENRKLKRKLWCQKCRTTFDRDKVAVVNIARRGRLRFERSKGEANEAMVSVFNPSVDASKLTNPYPES